MLTTQYYHDNRNVVEHIGLGQKKVVFSCNECLWMFETEAELIIHNYLEHLIMKKYVRNGHNDT